MAVLHSNPCPFCGWKDHQIIKEHSSSFYAQELSLSCLRCGADGPPANTPTKAYENWNQRSVTVEVKNLQDANERMVRGEIAFNRDTGEFVCKDPQGNVYPVRCEAANA